MDAAVRLRSKGRITIPRPVRETLQLSAGDSLMFRVDVQSAVLVRVPDLLKLAGAVAVLDEQRGISFDEIRNRARLTETQRHR